LGPDAVSPPPAVCSNERDANRKKLADTEKRDASR
jgi:hypothetical protein